jgi:hypothetical protein
MAAGAIVVVRPGGKMRKFDIAPFVLPNSPLGEYRFEEPRDIDGLALGFRTRVPRGLEVHYLQNKWPLVRVENHRDMENPAAFGWIPVDDQWNGTWRRARFITTVIGTTAKLAFRPLRGDGFPDLDAGYDVTFRRTLGLKVIIPDPDELQKVSITTRSPPARTSVRIHLDAGKKTAGRRIRLSTYNARILRVIAEKGVAVKGSTLVLAASGKKWFTVALEHMDPVHSYCADEAHLTLQLDHDAFTVCLQDLTRMGPVWHSTEGVYITRTDHDTPFLEYRARYAGATTILKHVSEQPEQSFAGAFYGQPRSHAVNYSLGCAHSPQRFWVEANGDMLLVRENIDFLGRKPELARRFLNRGSARFFFGFERWISCARFDGPSPAPVYTLQFQERRYRS